MGSARMRALWRGTLSIGPSAAVWLRGRLLLITFSEFRAG